MKILAIDPGLVNLGFAIVVDGSFAECGVATISRKKELVDELQRFADAMKSYGPFHCVAIERQMRANMRVISTHLYHMFEHAKLCRRSQSSVTLITLGCVLTRIEKERRRAF